MTKIYKGLNSVQNENVGEVTVLGLCTSCDDVLSLHQISWKYPKGFQRYWADTKSWRIDRRTHGRTDGQSDGQGDFYRASADSVRPLQSYWWMDGWMTCDFMSFSTVFQSYQDDGRLIMKDCVQWNSVYQSYWTDTISWQKFTKCVCVFHFS